MQILTIEKDSGGQQRIEHALSPGNFEVVAARDTATGLRLFRSIRPRIVVMDVPEPSTEYLNALAHMIAIDPGVHVIVLSAKCSPETALEVIQSGACDCMPTPVDTQKLRDRIDSLVGEIERRRKVFQLDRELLDFFQMEGIIGRSPVMLALFDKIRRVAPHFRTVLVTGATGTGKELVARALHRLSPVSSRTLAVCNCSALVETLLESELFGHVRGAFTGATQDKVGVFEYGNGSTVFLDEIGELPLPAQAKLLRILQSHELQRVGSPVPRNVDVRVVVATNRDLRSEVAAGRFREDLYYRLSMAEIHLPPLRERKEDLPLLQRHFVSLFSTQYGKEIKGITARAQAQLGRYSWPGNVRELENVIGNACMMTTENVIDLPDIPDFLKNLQAESPPEEGLMSLVEMQRRHVSYVLERVGGNKVQAARILGVSRTTVYHILDRSETPQLPKRLKAKHAGVGR